MNALNWTKYAATIDRAFNGPCDCRVGLVGKDFGDLSLAATVKHPAIARAAVKSFASMDEAKAWALSASAAINQRHQTAYGDNS